jgi:hypothetical protein
MVDRHQATHTRLPSALVAVYKPHHFRTNWTRDMSVAASSHPLEMIIRSLRRRIWTHLHLMCKSLAAGVEHELTISHQLVLFIPRFFLINLTRSLLFFLWLTRLGSASRHLTKRKRNRNRRSPPLDHGSCSFVPTLNSRPGVRSFASPAVSLRPFLCNDCGMNFARTHGESDSCRRNSRT